MSEDSDDRVKLLRLLRAGDQILNQLTEEFTRSGLFTPPLTHRGRVKSEKGALNKVDRKREDRPLYCVNDLRDIVGIRFITLLRKDISSVIESLFRLITGQNFQGLASILRNGNIEQCIQYVSATSAFSNEGSLLGDPLREQLNELVQLYFPEILRKAEWEVRPQYSSVHLIIMLEHVIEGERLIVPVEFQIRSVFEDAWGEIDHMLFYEADREGDLKGKQERLAAARHLAILKNLLDTAGEYAALISEGNFGVPRAKSNSILETLDGVSYFMEVSDPIKIHRDLIDAFADLIKLKESVDADKATPRMKKLASYASLADQFQELLSKFQASVSDSELAGKKGERLRAVFFLLQMEEAIARMLNSSTTLVKQALNSYRHITKEFPDRPTAWFRRAQAAMILLEEANSLDQLRQYRDEAVAAYKESRRLIDVTPANAILIASPGQRKYLRSNIERLMGFSLWRSVDLERKKFETVSLESLACVKQAYDEAISGLPNVAEETGARVSLLNSACYFQFEARNLGREFGDDTTSDPNFGTMLDDLEALIRKLERDRDESEDRYEQRKMNVWHTIMTGRIELADATGATRAADEVISAFAKGDFTDAAAYDREISQRAFQAAWELIKADRGSDVQRSHH